MNGEKLDHFQLSLINLSLLLARNLPVDFVNETVYFELDLELIIHSLQFVGNYQLKQNYAINILVEFS